MQLTLELHRIDPHAPIVQAQLAFAQPDQSVLLHQLAHAVQRRFQGLARGIAVGVGPQCGCEAVQIDVAATQRDQGLQQVERPSLCLAQERDALALDPGLEGAQGAQLQRPRPQLACVRTRQDAQPPDHLAHVVHLDAGRQRLLEQARQGVGQEASDEDEVARPCLAERLPQQRLA